MHLPPARSHSNASKLDAVLVARREEGKEEGKGRKRKRDRDRDGDREREREIDGIAREPQSPERNIESGLRGNQDSQRGPSERGRNEGQKQEPLLVSARHGWTRDGSAEEIAGWTIEAQRLNKEVEAKKRKLQETIERESGENARMDDAMIGSGGSLSS